MGRYENIQGNYIEKEESEKPQWEEKAIILQLRCAQLTLPTLEPLPLSWMRSWEPLP